MASREAREAVGAAGTQVAPEAPAAERPKRPRKGDLRDANVQADILNPPALRFTLVAHDGATCDIIVPLELTIAQINGGIADDLNTFAKLVSTEIVRLAPEARELGFEIVDQNPGYLEAALSRGNVRRLLREILARIAYVAKTEPPERVSVEQLTGLSDHDYFLCGLRFYTDAIKRRAEDAKNRQRTASA